jgi:hypothetical protein
MKADITVSEINDEALSFCRRVFSVKSARSTLDLTNISLQESYDLIWCGSLITHINETAIKNLLKFFYDHLSDKGVCIFTTLGMTPAKWIRTKSNTYNLYVDLQEDLLSQFDNNGFGYVDYQHQTGYGLSLVTYDYMSNLVQNVGNYKELYYNEQRWDNHQDVYAFTKY